MSTKQRFGQLMGQLSVNYRKELTEADIANLKLVCDRFGIDAFEHAVHSHMFDTDQGQYLPNIASITKHIIGTTKQNEQALEDKAALAWMAVERAISRIGAYGTLNLEDKQALMAVKHMGTWQDLCHTCREKMGFKRQEFIKNYQALENTEIENLPHSLHGIEDLNNQRLGVNNSAENLIKQIQERKNDE